MTDRRDSDAVWKALADPTRRAVLDLLAEAPRTTGALCAAFPQLGRTTVMKHLDVLEGAGLLIVRRQGRMRWNHQNPVPIEAIYQRWMRRHARLGARALLGLRTSAEARAAEAHAAETPVGTADRKDDP